MVISVVTPTLNSATLVRQALNSIARQAGTDIEIIIVDGGSTDTTLTVVDDFRNESPCEVKIVNQQGSGIYDAMNIGIETAHGKYIGILNSDDYYLPGALQSVRRYLEKGIIPALAGNAWGTMPLAGESVMFPLMASWPPSAFSMGIIHPSIFVRRDLYHQFGLYDTSLKLSADYDFFLRLAHAGVHPKIVPDFFAVFRLGGASTSRLRTLLWENFIIRSRFYGRRAAFATFARDIFRNEYSRIRERVLRLLLGDQRFERIRAQRLKRRFAKYDASSAEPVE